MRQAHVRTILAVLTLISALSPSARAQDHLEPEEGILNADRDDWNYATKLRRMLMKDAAFYYVARMICLPSSDPEWVVTLAVEDNDVLTPGDKVAYVVQYVGAEKNLWDQKKKKWRDIGVKKAQASLDKETAEAIQDVWRLMLRTVKYPEKDRDSLDGTTYHFSRAVALLRDGRPNPHGGFEQGQIDNPPANSLAGELATIGEELRNYALARNEEREKLQLEIRARAARLKATLEGRRQPE